jgi:hypothetical protein
MSNWHNWSTNPPQISGVPLLVRLGGFTWLDRIQDVTWIGVVEGLEWAGTGIYREEYWQTTGQWL